MPDAPFIHPTAEVEAGVTLGRGTRVYDHAHLRRGAAVGEDCIVGGKSYVAGGATVGDRCKVNTMVAICAGVTLEAGVMVGAGTVFTNDRFPRATTPDLRELRGSDPDEHTLPTLVREGATLGAGCTVGCGLTVGRFAMVGMGSVVTKSVPDFALALGHPARVVGYVCRCGGVLARFAPGGAPESPDLTCAACGRGYRWAEGGVTEHAT